MDSKIWAQKSINPILSSDPLIVQPCSKPFNFTLLIKVLLFPGLIFFLKQKKSEFDSQNLINHRTMDGDGPVGKWVKEICSSRDWYHISTLSFSRSGLIVIITRVSHTLLLIRGGILLNKIWALIKFWQEFHLDGWKGSKKDLSCPFHDPRNWLGN